MSAESTRAHRSAFRNLRTNVKKPGVAEVPAPVNAITKMSARDQAEALMSDEARTSRARRRKR